MEIKFLGSGSAFVSTKENFHANALVSHEGKNLLIDAGFHIAEALEFNGIALKDVNAIFLTHNHADHNGGLEYLGYRTFFDPDLEKPILVSDPKILEVLWNNVLRGNMGSLSGRRVQGLTEYFNIVAVPPRSTFEFSGVWYAPVRMPHVIDDYDEVPAFGLKWECNGIRYFFSGDVMFDFWRLMPFWEYGHIIFQECEFYEYDNSVHSQFRFLKTIPEQYKEKMWLYHYSLNGKTYEELESMVLEAGFKGLVKRGQVFNMEKENGQINI